VALALVATFWIGTAEPGQALARRVRVTEGAPITAAPGTVRVQRERNDAAAWCASRDGDGDFVAVTFDILGGYDCESPDRGCDRMPAAVKAFNGRKVAVQGFMCPLTRSGTAVTSFMLLKDRCLCVFGRSPRMNERISVKMAEGQYAPYVNDQPVTVFGVMDVGGVYEKGTFKSIYRIAAEQVAGALGL
jgi:hypothetical protein